MYSRLREISRLWLNVIDVIGPINLWPKDVRKLFWKKNGTLEGGFKVAVFVYINGLNPLLLYEWIEVYGNITNRSSKSHVRYLIELYEEGTRYR